MLDGTFYGSTSAGGIHPGSGKQFRQRDVIPLAYHLIQQPLQLAGALHPQAGQQCTAAANGHGNIGKQLPGVGPKLPHTDDIHRIRHAGKQKDSTHDGAEVGQGFVPLFCVLLLSSGDIVAVDWLSVPGRLTGTGVLWAEIAGIFRVLLLLFFGIPVNGTQDEKQNAQRC